MDNLNFETIERLRSLFRQMSDSRRLLRPIIADIANSLERGFFIDNHAEEINLRLKQILDIQVKLSYVESIRKAVNSKKIDQVEQSINFLEQNYKRDKINATLARIEMLVVDSDDPAIIESVKKVKLQSEYLRNKSAKMELEEFSQLAERFLLLVKIIDNAEKFSSSDFISVSNSFSDNPLIAMVLTSRLIHFPRLEKTVEPAAPAPAPVPANDPLTPNKHRLSAVMVKFEKVKPDLELVQTNPDNFTIQKSNHKKNLSVKSFNNKIRQLFDSVDTLQIFKILVKSRIFFINDPCNFLQNAKMTKKIAAIVPRLFDKLFDWGIVDKVTWREHEFYFLNNSGLDLCIRCFTKANPPGNSDYFGDLFHALQFSFFLFLEHRLKSNLKISLAYNSTLPIARAQVKDRVYLFASLVLLGEDWAAFIASFKILIEDELDYNLSVFLCALSKKDLPWLKLFDTVKFKKVPFYMFTCDGLFNQYFDEVDLDATLSGHPKFAVGNAQLDIFSAPPELPKETVTAAENPVETKIVETETQIIEVQTETKIDEPEQKKIETATVEVAPVKAEVADVQTKTSDADIKIADMFNHATALFKGGEIAHGMLALHALADFSKDDWTADIVDLVGFVLEDPVTLQKIDYEGLDVFNFCETFPNAGNLQTQYLNLAAILKVFFEPPDPNSYKLNKIWRNVDSIPALKNCPAAKNLISLLYNFTADNHCTFAESLPADNSVATVTDARAELKKLDSVAESLLHSDVNHRRVKDVINQLFKPNGIVRKYLSVENFSADELKEFYSRFIDADNSVSEEKIGDFLDEIWDKPTVQLSRREHEPFIGPKRKKIAVVMKQIVTLLIECANSDNRPITKTAPAATALELLKTVKKQIEKRVTLGSAAFLIFVDNLARRLKGQEISFSYNFCLAGKSYIELDEDGLPDFENFGTAEFSFYRRFEDFEASIAGKTFGQNIKISYETALKNYDAGILKNLEKNFLQQLGVSSDEINRKIAGITRLIDRLFERYFSDFLLDIELARYSHANINSYMNAVLAAKEHFTATQNPGIFFKLINSLKAGLNFQQINSAAVQNIFTLDTLKDFLNENEYEIIYRTSSQRVNIGDALSLGADATVAEILAQIGFGGGAVTEAGKNYYTVTFENSRGVLGIFGQKLEIFNIEGNNLQNVYTKDSAICFVNAALTLSERRALAKAMKLNPNQENIIVIDKVLAFYLTRFEISARAEKLLLTALPFANVQPYATENFLPDMFIGRSEELAQIIDMDGANLIYGGRKFGKTALLKRVQFLENRPEELKFAILIDLEKLNPVQAMKKIAVELEKFNKDPQPEKVLLLLDNSDTFFGSDATEPALDVLREVMKKFSGKFKFVFAGTNAVMRFAQNSDLKSLAISPFKPAEAMELFLKPMSYLGFTVENENLLNLILSRTNYYPNLIHCYCKILLESVAQNYETQNFNITKNPPYILDDNYLKSLLGNAEFQQELHLNFKLALNADKNNFYEIIALALAWLCYDKNRPISANATEIKNVCLMCSVDKINKLSDAELLNLLEEMVAFDILAKTDDGKFEFSHYAFWHMLGTEEEINDKLDLHGANS